MIIYSHFFPEDEVKLIPEGNFVRLRFGNDDFQVHCLSGSRPVFVEQLRQQVDLLVREEARIVEGVKKAEAVK